MSYIGVQTQNIVSPQFQREVVTGTGTDEYTLVQDVPGFNADNVTVVVNNVLQEPNNAYTITADANGNPRVLNFNGTNLAATDTCYVQHKGIGTLNITPAAGSVNAAALQDNLRSGNVDTFTATANQTAFTLSETPLNAQSISVFLGGVYQRPTTNYTVSGTTLTLTSGANVGEEVDVHHHTIRSTVSHVPDGGVTSGKLDTNIQVAGTLGVTGATTLTGAVTVPTPTATGHAATKAYVDASGIAGVSSSGSGSSDTVTMAGNLTVTSNLTVSGTTTTIDTATTTSDSLIVNNAGSDVGIKVNSTSTGNILQLQDGGVDKVVVADGGNTTFSGNVLVDTIAEKTSANGVAIDGVTLKDGGVTLTGDLVPATPLSHRNMVINGAMQIAQRGTSSTSSGYYSVDRFTINSSGGTTTQSQGTETSGTVYELGLTKYARITNTSGANGAGDYRFIQQSIEAQNIANSGWNFKSSSSYVTLSFWVRSSVAQNFYGLVKSEDGTAQYYSFETGSLSANTWTKVTKTISGNSSIQIDNDNGSGFQIMISPFTGTTYTDASRSLNTWSAWNTNQRFPDMTNTWVSTSGSTFDVTGVQLERGSVATPFEHRTYADELTRCYRYYERLVTQVDYGSLGSGVVANATSAYIHFFFHAQKRVRPSFSYSNVQLTDAVSGSPDVSALLSNYLTLDGGFCGLQGSAGGMTAGRGSLLRGANNAAGYIEFSAEL